MLILALTLILISGLLSACGSGGSEASATLTDPPPPPAPASLLYRADHTLVKSQTDGTVQVTLAEEPAGFNTIVVVGAQVMYETPQIPPVTNMEDIWAVQTNGTDRHLVVHDPVHETHLRDVIGPWMLYDARPGRSFEPPPPSLASVLLNGTASRIIMAAEGAGEIWQTPNYERQAGGRAIVEFAGNLFSLLPDGTDQRQLTFYDPLPHLNNEPFVVVIGVPGVVADRAIYSIIPIGEATPKLFTVPVSGGPIAQLGTGSDYEFLGVVVGSRVVYHRCAVLSIDTLGPCDVYSVNGNGTGSIAVSTHQDNDAVQGVIGSQVVIRRNHGGPTDTLVSAPVSGGAETTLLTLSFDDEFVMAIVGDRIVLQRTTGYWSIKADGSGLIQLTTEDPAFEAVHAVGPFACFNRGEALWCVPADGSAPPTKVTEKGTFVVGL
jgi:hypothetical protein